jgi:hypothetical protein
MSAAKIRESPVRDANVFGERAPQMVDNLEVHSTASSDISESLRERILGKGYARRRLNRAAAKTTQSQHSVYNGADSSYEVVPSKESFEIVSNPNGNQNARSGGDNKSIGEQLSYHSANSGGSKTSFRKNSSFVVVARDPEGASNAPPMKTADERRYTTIETQTVAIQTVEIGADTDLDCRCAWGDQQCTCSEYDSQQCLYGRSSKRADTSGETSDPSIYGNFTESSSQTSRRKHCTCNCRRCRCYDYDTQSISDHSDNSDDSYTTDFFDLPYQNNEEYLKLLRELEKKLIARNKARVRRTMMEFEKRSRQNHNSDAQSRSYRCDDDCLLRKLQTRSHKENICCKCGRHKRVNSDILQNEKRWEEMDFEGAVQGSDNCIQTPRRVERSLHKSHWQLDPRSGEWVKVSCFQQTDFSRPPPHGDFVKEENKKVAPPGPTAKKECYCRQKKRR